MNCPKCQNKMQPGEGYVHGSVVGWLLAGFAYQHCYFKSNNQEKPITVINSPKTVSAWRCSTCGIVTLEENKTSS